MKPNAAENTFYFYRGRVALYALLRALGVKAGGRQSRALRPLDPTITLPWVQEITALYSDEEVIRARNATLLARPDNVKAYFTAQFRKIIPAQVAPRPMAGSIKSAPESDPYGF